MERRQRRYLALMGLCLGLIVVAWWVVRLYSTAWAVGMSVVAMVIPPIAVIVGNAGWEQRVPPRRARRDE